MKFFLIFCLITLIYNKKTDNRRCELVKNGECVQCKTNYLLVDGKCVILGELNCEQFDEAKGCLSCMEGFLLTNFNTCLYIDDLIVNCKDYKHESDEIICSLCESGYRIVRNRCVRDIPNCQEFAENRNICLKCSGKFSLSDNGRFCK